MKSCFKGIVSKQSEADINTGATAARTSIGREGHGDKSSCRQDSAQCASEVLPKLVLWGAWEVLDETSRRNLRLSCRQLRTDSTQLITRAHLRHGQQVTAASVLPNLCALVVSGGALEAMAKCPTSTFCRLMHLTWMGHSSISQAAAASSYYSNSSSLKSLILRSLGTLKAITIHSENVIGCPGLFESMSSLESLRLTNVTLDTSLDEMVRICGRMTWLTLHYEEMRISVQFGGLIYGHLILLQGFAKLARLTRLEFCDCNLPDPPSSGCPALSILAPQLGVLQVQDKISLRHLLKPLPQIQLIRLTELDISQVITCADP